MDENRDVDDNWRDIERREGLLRAKRMHIHNAATYRRVYRVDDVFVKVNLLSCAYRRSAGFQSLENEAKMMRLVEGLGLAPHVLDYRNMRSYEIIRMKRVNGYPLDQINMGVLRSVVVIVLVFYELIRLSRYKVSHGDLAPDNIILSESQIVFIDFGYAGVRKTCWSAFWYNLFKINIKSPGFNRPFALTAPRLVEFALPRWIRPYFRGLLRMKPYTRHPNIFDGMG